MNWNLFVLSDAVWRDAHVTFHEAIAVRNWQINKTSKEETNKGRERNSENDKIYAKNENEHPRMLLASGKYHITSHFSANRIQSTNIGIDIIIQFILCSSFICRRFWVTQTYTHARSHAHSATFAGVADRVLCDDCCLLFLYSFRLSSVFILFWMPFESFER